MSSSASGCHRTQPPPNHLAAAFHGLSRHARRRSPCHHLRRIWPSGVWQVEQSVCFETCEGSVPTAHRRSNPGPVRYRLHGARTCSLPVLLSRCVAHIPKDMGDATMSKLDQVASGQPGAFGIIVGDSGIAEALSSGLSMQTQGTPHSNTASAIGAGESCTNRRASPSTLPLLSILRNGAGSSPIARGT